MDSRQLGRVYWVVAADAMDAGRHKYLVFTGKLQQKVRKK